MAFTQQIFIGLLRFKRIIIKIPKLKEAQEVRTLICEFSMGLICRLTLIHWPFTRVLNAKRTGDNQNLAQYALLFSGQNHAADSWV